MKRTLSMLALVLLALSARAGSTGTTSLFTMQGSWADRAFGDYVSRTDTLDTFYRFYVEVPPSVSRLTVDVFDADIGLGGATEDTAGRDRDRNGYDSDVRYSLYGPDGVQRLTAFTTGNDAGPAGSDNAWLALFSATTDSYRDEFGSVAYNLNAGTLPWSTNWTEGSDDGSPAGGDVFITAGTLRIDRTGNSAQRQADLSGFATATLTFDVSTQAVDAGDEAVLEVSTDGVNWTTLETFSGAVSGARSHNLNAYRTSATRIRFRTTLNYGNNDFFIVDNVQIADSGVKAGHWEIRVDMSSAVTGGDDINAFGLRAHDGTPGSGGTELPVYADTLFPVGVNPPNSGTATREYTLHPWVVSGCTCSQNDYDYDSDSGTIGSASFTSRPGTFTQTLTSATLSANDTWNRDSISGWVSDLRALGYGIWTLEATIASYLVGGTPNGNYGASYIGSFAAAANPPSANPLTGGIRVYLPTDAGAAPAKPYLEQELVIRGPNPVVVGQPSRFTVTVRFVNPTTRPVVFSTPSNVITANVPGSGAVFGGNAQVAQGTITSQPSVGGTGNIVWNPGTVAAGATVIFSYDVLATAASAGQRVPITATPASGNGTRATFVDETGSTTQARATATLGPLCELAMTQGLVTDVMVASFDASVRGGRTFLEWTTAFEAGTVGFNVYRMSGGQKTRINQSLLPSMYGSPHGRYRLVDDGGADASALYLLEEVTASGRVNQYGPYAINGKASNSPGGFTREPRTGASPVKPAAKGPKKTKVSAVAVSVVRSGVTRVTASTIAETLGVAESQVNAAIRTGRIRVTDRGREIAVLPDAAGNHILFYARASESIFSAERVYRLELERGTSMSAVSVSPANGAVTVFDSVVDHEIDAFAATVLPLDPESDFWFEGFVIPGAPGYERTGATFTLEGVADGSGRVKVRLQGAIADVPRRVRVRVNSVPVGDVEFSGLGALETDLVIPASVLRSGENSVEVEGLGDGSTFDVFYLDGFSVTYRRFAQALAGALDIVVPANGAVIASGFSAPLVLDVTNDERPQQLRGITAVNGVIGFSTSARAIAVVEPAAVLQPHAIRAIGQPLLRQEQQADYVVIAPGALLQSADALAAIRRAEGLRTLVVDVEQIYDEFSGGNATPHAIREFIRSTAAWSRAPKYFVLAGNGTYDYRNVSFGAGLLPPLMERTSSGLFASDVRFADFNGDAIPEVAIGRLPVGSAAELDAYVAKLTRARRAGLAGTSVVYVDDFADRGTVFSDATDRARGSAPDVPGEQISLDLIGTDAARVALFDAWREGVSLVNWFGHGGLDRLSAGGLLSNEDVPQLASASGLLPILLAMTCSINRFEVGVFEPLGSLLTRLPDAGAIAVWSASGLSVHDEAAELNRTIIRLAGERSGQRIGDLILASLRRSAPARETASVYLLLGDPAEPLRLPAAPAPAPAGRGGE